MNIQEAVRRRILVPRNRMLRMRMRDGGRWVTTYRDRAWKAAVEEARTRGFLASLLFAVTRFAEMSAKAKETTT